MIPKILHRTVPQFTTTEVEIWWRGWKDLMPEWEFRTWRDPLDQDRFPHTGLSWRKCSSGAQLAGLVRLEVLLEQGGVYVDSDVQPIRALDSLLALRAFAAWESDAVVPDAVLGAEPGHPAIAECLDLAIRRVGERADPFTSGPGVTTKVLPGRADTLLLPPGSFYPYHFTEKHRRGEDYSRLPWCFGVHHWAGSWL